MASQYRLVLNAAAALLHPDEVVEVAVEGSHEIPDDGAPNDDVLVPPGGVRVVWIGAEVLVADVEPAGDRNACIRLAVDDPHLLVEALVERGGVGVRHEHRHRHLVQPLQRHRLVALDLDAVLLEVEVHPLRLQPGVREGVHDDAHVEAGRLLLLEDLGDAQAGLVTLEHQRLDADRPPGILEQPETGREGILSALQDRNPAVVRPTHREQPGQSDLPVRAAGEPGVRTEHRSRARLGDEAVDLLRRVGVGRGRGGGASGKQARGRQQQCVAGAGVRRVHRRQGPSGRGNRETRGGKPSDSLAYSSIASSSADRGNVRGLAREARCGICRSIAIAMSQWSALT